MTKVEIPFTEAKPRRAKRWVLLLLPGLLLTVLIILSGVYTLNAWSASNYTTYTAEGAESYHFRLNHRTKRLLLEHWGSFALSDSLPTTVESIVRDGEGTLSLHLLDDQIIAGSYGTKNGLVYLGDATQLQSTKRLRLFSPSFYVTSNSADKQGRLRLTASDLTVHLPSEPFTEVDPLLPATAKIAQIYNQKHEDTTNPLASSRIILGTYQDTPFFHITLGQTDRTSVEQLLVRTLSTGSLSTSVETNGYTYRTRIITAQHPPVISNQAASDVIELYLEHNETGEKIPTAHAIISVDKSVITNLPLEQANYEPISGSTSCLKRAHTFTEQHDNTHGVATTLSEAFHAPTAQSSNKIRYCF